MKTLAYIAVGVAATLAVVVAAGVAFIGFGVYDIGADDHHTRPVLALIEQLRDRSIAVRAAPVSAPSLEDPQSIAAGAARYAQLCTGCHLGPGINSSGLRTGLYPHPPNLAQAEIVDPRRTFWVIKHGIKMSGMPAWGKTLDDAAVWDLVAFVRELPTLSTENYQRLTTHPQ